MDIYNILLLITAGVNFALATFVLSKNFKERVNIIFILLVFSLGLWSMGVAMFRYESLDQFALGWLKFYFVVGTLIAYLFYYFAYYYPYVLKREPKLLTIFHFLIMSVTIWISVSGNSYVNSYESFMTVNLNQPKHLFFITYFIYMVCMGFFVLGRKISGATGAVRRQLKIIFIATLIAGIFGVSFDVILPEFTYEYIYVGPYFTMVMAYIIFNQLFLKEDS